LVGLVFQLPHSANLKNGRIMKRIILLLLFLIFLQFPSFLGGALIGIKCQNGVIFAYDNAPEGGNSMMRSRAGSPLFLLNEKVAVGCLENKFAFFKIFSKLKQKTSSFRALYREELSISAIANYARYLVNKHYPDASVVIGGYEKFISSNLKEEYGDRKEDLPLYQLFHVTKGGSLFQQDYVVAGTGGELASSLIDNSFQETTGFVPTISKQNRKNGLDPFKIPWKGYPPNSLHVSQALEVLKKAMKTSFKYDHTSGGDRASFLIVSQNLDL
jgi:20S proteasome alpha/beta subunit